MYQITEQQLEELKQIHVAFRDSTANGYYSETRPQVTKLRLLIEKILEDGHNKEIPDQFFYPDDDVRFGGKLYTVVNAAYEPEYKFWRYDLSSVYSFGSLYSIREDVLLDEENW